MKELYQKVEKNINILNISNKLSNESILKNIDINFINNILKIIYSDFNFKINYEFNYYKIKLFMHYQYYSLILSILRTIGLNQHKIFQPNIDGYFEDVIYIEDRDEVLKIIDSFLSEFKNIEDRYFF